MDIARALLSFLACFLLIGIRGGPSYGLYPKEFTQSPPKSYMGDDCSPIEFSWVITKDHQDTIRFTVEPLSCTDGSPTKSTSWMATLNSLACHGLNDQNDLTWPQICFNTLVASGNGTPISSQHVSQFSIGADFTRAGIVGKAYFLPHIRSQYTGVSPTEIVSECMRQLNLHSQWGKVSSYIATLPDDRCATPEIVAVDCVHRSKNRAKIYLRTRSRNLRDLKALFTLGGALDSPSVRESMECFEHLWSLLFGNIAATTDLVPTNPAHYASGFVVYFELSLNHPDPAPKIYLPVRHYCSNDETIGNALAKYYKDIGNEEISKKYVKCIQEIFCHRPLSLRTGIHTYVGCAARKNGAQVSIYYSPEVFAPERI
ncbi:aromatic prenyltransferase [Collybia nuda]|uniref:Aromatic prenyltransferase n=1 Tax=Collybia nuda TaxID=64659 RepID=A0A9P6CDD7_9AGAR|nr:aromatic prenyltransferase [Collybia nuda]